MRDYTLRLSQPEVQGIIDCLNQAPYHIAAPIIDKVARQIRAQETNLQEELPLDDK